MKKSVFYLLLAGVCVVFSNTAVAQITPNLSPNVDSTYRYVKTIPGEDTTLIGLRQLIADIYSSGQTCNQSYSPTATPSWSGYYYSQPDLLQPYGVLYAGDPCDIKVGINASVPQSIFDVRAINSAEPLIQGGVMSSNQEAFRIKNIRSFEQVFTVMGSGQMAISMPASSTDDRAIRVSDQSGVDAFRVLREGAVYATEYYAMLKSEFPSYPDYVFDESYQLMPLNELQEYVKQNKHLPNIPSAKEIHEQGSINLAEMNRLYLEKIEELTLYILQLEERISDLEKQK